MTQALGLTFHELATNALKYGEAGNSSDALKVEWQVRDQGSMLSLSWRETSSAAVTPPEKPGFGTRLIDMNITQGTERHDPARLSRGRVAHRDRDTVGRPHGQRLRSRGLEKERLSRRQAGIAF